MSYKYFKPDNYVWAIAEDFPVLLSDVCSVKVNFEDANFWLIRVGSKDKVGMPVKKFHEERIGIKVIKTDLLLPDYLFYVFLHLHQQKYFEIFCAQGTLSLVYIKLNHVKNLRLRLSSE